MIHLIWPRFSTMAPYSAGRSSRRAEQMSCALTFLTPRPYTVFLNQRIRASSATRGKMRDSGHKQIVPPLFPEQYSEYFLPYIQQSRLVISWLRQVHSEIENGPHLSPISPVGYRKMGASVPHDLRVAKIAMGRWTDVLLVANH